MSKQILAKAGVFALIVVNLGAYYVFWPSTATHGPNDFGRSSGNLPMPANGDNPGNSLQLASTASAAQPGTHPGAQPGDTGKPSPFPGDTPPATLQALDPEPKATDPPAPPLMIAQKESSAQGLPAIPDPLVGPGGSSPANPPTVPKPFDPLPPAKTSTLPTRGNPPDRTLDLLKQARDSVQNDVAPPKALTGVPGQTKIPDPAVVQADRHETTPIASEASPWTLQMEIAGGQTTLNARLNKRIEFRIICDHVEMKTPDGKVLAVGKVRLTGPGVQGTCNRLVIGLHQDRLVLEGKAELKVQQGAPTDFACPTVEMQGEQLSYRLQEASGGVVPAHAFPAPAAMPSSPPGSPSPFSTPRPFPLEKNGR